MDIQSINPDYQLNDPSTWPLLTDATPTDTDEEYYVDKAPPRWLAYRQDIMYEAKHTTSVLRLHPYFKDTHGVWHSRFFDYPFNFDKTGTFRTHAHLPQEELAIWQLIWKREAVKDLNKIKAQRAAPKSSALLQASENGNDMSAETAYDHIMRTLSDSTTSPTKTKELESQLKQAQDNLQKEKGRANKAEARLKDETKQLADQKRQTESAKQLLNTEKATSAEALRLSKLREDTIRHEFVTLEERLESKVKELDAAKKEAKDANDKIVGIWAEMQKRGVTENEGKRKAGSEEKGRQNKRLRRARTPEDE